jgi:heterodisulfide reductase subunit A
VCPYSALTWDADLRVARVADLLCMSCGTCVAACPSGAITGHGFTRDMLRRELEGVLA